MSRLRLFLQSVASSYAVMGAGTIYSLASVPLALHYLTPVEFGLWELIDLFASYLELMNMGMAASVSRHLIDHKDQPATGRYGSLIKTGMAVLSVQGLLILSIGLTLSPAAARLLAIPIARQATFVALLRLQCGLVAFRFFTRILDHLLYAHQRNDIANFTQVGLFALSFVVLWVAFHFQAGIFAMIWASASGMGIAVAVAWWACVHLRLLPPRGAWGRPNWAQFKELFSYSKDVFLLSVGSQLITASQSFVITRTLGLSAVAAWAVGTKIFSLVLQLCFRTYDLSGPAFMEMIVRGERERLRTRFRSILVVMAALGGAAAVGLVLCNSQFVALWTAGKIAWNPRYDLLLGVWLIVMILTHCHCGLVLATKRIGNMRYVYLLEGITFVVLAGLFTGRGGLATMVAISILCSMIFSLAYGIHHTARYFGFSPREVAVGWQLPALKIIVTFAPAAAVTWLVLCWLPAPVRLAGEFILAAPVGFWLFLRLGIPDELRQELFQRATWLPKRAVRQFLGGA